MNSKIRLTLFEERFGWGGIETFISNVCTMLDPQRYEIRIVTVNKVTDHFDALFVQHGIVMDVLVEEVIADPIRRFKVGLGRFKEYLKSHSCDIMHFHLSNSIDMQYVMLAKKAGIEKRIVHSHNSSATSAKKILAHRIGKLFWSHSANYYMACSKKAAKWLFPGSVYRKNAYELIRNAIPMADYAFDPQARIRIRVELGWTDKLVFGEVGRFNIQKNHRFLIDIFEQIHLRREDAILVLVGEGELLTQIGEYVAAKHLTEYVQFMGNSDRVAQLQQGFDVFLLPSLYEGLPFVMVEAQAASLPMLVSDTITREIGLTKYANYYPLRQGAQAWADKAIACSKIARDGAIQPLYEAGFDRDRMIQRLDACYRMIYSGEMHGE